MHTAKAPHILVAIGALVPGCADLASVDEYSVEEPPPSDVDLPSVVYEPKPAYLTGPECEACVSERCGEQITACDSNSFCADGLTHMRSSPEPLAAYQRYLMLTNEQWEGARGGEDRSVVPNSLVSCTTMNCRRVCDLGRDFSCMGKFEWSIAYPTQLKTRLMDVASNPTSKPWRIRACLQADAGCVNPVADAQTVQGGFAVLDIMPTTSPYQGFGGFLLMTGNPDFHEWATIVSRPFISGDYSPWKLPDKPLIDTWFEKFDATFDPNMGYVWVIPADCRGLAAKGVKLDVQLANQGELQACSTCVYTYENDDGAPEAGRTDFSSAGRVGFVSFVPPRQVVLTVRDTSSDLLVARHNISVAAGRFHFVKMFPASATQLAGPGDSVPRASN